MFRNLFRKKVSGSSVTKVSFFLWLLSIAVFFLFIYFENISKNSYGNAIGITILVGVLFFILMLFSYLFEDRNKNIVGGLIKEEKKRNFSFTKTAVALVFLVLLGVVGSFIYQGNIQRKKELLLLEKEIEQLKYSERQSTTNPTNQPQVVQQTQPVVTQKTAPAERQKVAYTDKTGTQLANQTFYCYADRVNELNSLVYKIEKERLDVDSCFFDMSIKYDNCSRDCDVDENGSILPCLDKCEDKYGGDRAYDETCKDESEDVENAVDKYWQLVYEICP